tara:strand:- start:824 stop:1018 length:195 start_codon:yes stop_codon:yes gene_type:complete
MGGYFGSRLSPANAPYTCIRADSNVMTIGECDRAGVKTMSATMLPKKAAAFSIGNAAAFLIVSC